MKKQKVTQKELKTLIEKLRFIGYQMSNVCYNLSQRNGCILTKDTCKCMGDLVRKWDALPKGF